jgi:alcohol dehydrogenase (NADP+)
VGTVVKVGNEVKHIKLGDRCGVGAQSWSCMAEDCEECMAGLEQYCYKAFVGTYNGKYPDGSQSFGGYSDYWRGPGHFVVKIPDGLSSAEAAPMLCGGITTYSPLVRNGAGPGKSVGIVGVGGLGHFGIMWAKALGCDKVVAISRSSSKEADTKKMGADYLIATGEDEKWAKKNARSLDLIICTISDPKMPIRQYLQLLRTNGHFIQVGAPEEPIPSLNINALVAKSIKIGGSSIGSPADIAKMLQFAVEKNVHSFIQERPMKDANQAIVDQHAGHARYRYVLVNEEHAKL